MTLEQDLAKSREFEMRTYLNSTSEMYGTALEENAEVYDLTFKLTDKFTSITKEAILKDSRIIKTLRYAVSPTISQMKFGQLFGHTSIDKFENATTKSNTAKYKDLEKIAGNIAIFINQKIDKQRFIWLVDSTLKTDIVCEFAKKWTCSLAADQNAQTAYRNWRKSIQERAIIDELERIGYRNSNFSGTIENQEDINPGQYTKETKVHGRTVQKADVAFRSRSTGNLVLVEAKAVGVELDATKRIKECSDKAHDWNARVELGSPEIIAVIAGFFTKQNISNLESSNIHVVWEHRLSDLGKQA